MKEHYEVQNCLPDAIGPLSVCLSATLEYCGQTVGRIKTKLGLQVGLGHGHIVLDGAQPPLQKRGRTAPPQFSAHVCYGQTVAHLSYC